MIALKPMIKKNGKTDRERKVLFGLIEHYIKTGKPVGSNTLKDDGFEDLSSATIRNYFAHLEEGGFLHQQHSSGGRIPTSKAFRSYAAEFNEEILLDNHEFDTLRSSETKEIASFLQQSAEQLAENTKTAIFLSAPRFDQDFIVAIKLMVIDSSRCLCVMISDFGEVMTEIIYVPNKVTVFSAKRIEAYFNWKLTGRDRPENLTKEDEEVAQTIYNEVMLRFIVNYTQFSEGDVYRTGFSRLLAYPEYHDGSQLASCLSLFENTHGMKLLLKDCCAFDRLKFWVAEDLATYCSQAEPNCAVIAMPYYVNRQPVGAIGILGPTRMPYRTIFKIIRNFSESISHALTNNLYKFKVTLRQPKTEFIDRNRQDFFLIGQTSQFLLEDKRSGHADKREVHQTRRHP